MFMFRFPYKKSLVLLLGLAVLAAPFSNVQIVQARDQSSPSLLPALFAMAASAPAPEEAIQFADQLISKLSGSKPFTDWSGARPEFQPLGPGMHAWLVTLNREGKPVGYLIIGARPSGGYALIEYGAGPEPLFDTDALQQALAAESSLYTHSASSPADKALQAEHLQIEHLYAGPVLAEWRIINRSSQAKGGQVQIQAQAAYDDALALQYRDARNADPLPDNEAFWQKLLAAPLQLSSAIVSSGTTMAAPKPPTITADSFDPNDNLLWLASDKLQLTASALTRELSERKSLVFAARSDDRNYTLPLPVYGYQIWGQGGDAAGERVYVMTGSDASPRFIAFDELAKAGQFYSSIGR
ncbi:hypothetical protein [Paenibacillus fonticola]|uniref:hypothetical protein n=1 Tax=Paenibacillus fonticola TaxID=379896 RepID=UPI0003773E68|nr:hypothetical protein [Paenibacillus fonticola]